MALKKAAHRAGSPDNGDAHWSNSCSRHNRGTGTSRDNHFQLHRCDDDLLTVPEGATSIKFYPVGGGGGGWTASDYNQNRRFRPHGSRHPPWLPLQVRPTRSPLAAAVLRRSRWR